MLEQPQTFLIPSLQMGCDLIKIERIAKLLQKHPYRFLNKIFTEKEKSFFPLADSARFISYIAKRFAAKEAFSKALGTGLGHALKFHDVEIVSCPHSKKPSYQINSRIVEHYCILSSSLSLSDEKDYGLAFCGLMIAT